jgi:hypothetical protein
MNKLVNYSYLSVFLCAYVGACETVKSESEKDISRYRDTVSRYLHRSLDRTITRKVHFVGWLFKRTIPKTVYFIYYCCTCNSVVQFG